MFAHVQKASNRISRLTGGNLVLSRKVWSWTSWSSCPWTRHHYHLVLHWCHHQVEDTPCIVIYNTGDLVSPNKPITQRLVPVDKVWKLVLSTSYQNYHHHQSLCQTNLFLNLILGVDKDRCELDFNPFGWLWRLLGPAHLLELLDITWLIEI